MTLSTLARCEAVSSEIKAFGVSRADSRFEGLADSSLQTAGGSLFTNSGICAGGTGGLADAPLDDDLQTSVISDVTETTGIPKVVIGGK